MTVDVERTTRLVRQVRQGDAKAADELLPLLYDELRTMAKAMFARQKTPHTLQPTALLHEAYLKLVHQSSSDIQDSAHFFRIAARAMRQVLIDHARASKAVKRGGGVREFLVNDPAAPAAISRLDWLALDEAIEKLAALDNRQAAVVEMRFFGGMTVQQTADALGVSPRTVEFDWRMARAWLSRYLNEDG